MSRFYHVGLNWRTAPRHIAVDAALNVLAPDWARYSPTAWLVWTDLTAQQLAQKILPICPGDDLLVVPIEPGSNYSGWMPTWIWAWLQRPRTQSDWVPPPAIPGPEQWSALHEVLKLPPPRKD